MKNLTKLLGFIALAAIIGLSLAGCDTGIDDITKSSLTGNVTLSNNSPKVGESITATYAPGNGAGAQTWQWFRIDAGTEDLIQNATTNIYTATTNDLGKKIKAQLSYADRSGSLSATTTNAVTTANSDITYTIARADGADGTANTTAINFTFSAAVTGLTTNDITITSGTGAVTKGALSGSGTSWSLGVTVTTAGNLTVQITKTGIEAGPKDVTVYMEGQTAPTLDSITAVYTQGAITVYPTTPLESLRANLTVTAAYSNGANLPVTAYALSGTLIVGASAVTVTFEGKETTFTVNVTAAPLNKTLTGITLNTTSVKRDYNQNEMLDLAGLVVTANYSDGSSAAVSYTSSSPTNGSPLSTAGTITVTVNYTEGTITRSNTFTVTVIDITTPTEGLAYELIDNGTAYRVRKGTVTGGAVVIPATYEGLPVREIGSVDDGWYAGAFSSTNITSITIPTSVTSIGHSAFSSTDITSITIPENVTSIGDGAFAQCTSLTSVTIHEGVTSIGDGVFYNCTGLTSIIIPASVTSIGDTAFENCTSITEITIPASVTSVGRKAFSNWGSVNSQTIYVEGYNNEYSAREAEAWGNDWIQSCYAVIVFGVVSEIAITQQPAMTLYLIGEQLDITGLVVTARFADNSTETVTITAANITGFDSATTGTKTLSVTYRGKTATFTVTVIEIANGDILVTNTNEWNAAKTTISTGGNNQSYTVYVRGSFSVAGSTANTFGSVTGLTVTLKGSGTLRLSSQGNMFRIGENQTLIIDSAGLTLRGLYYSPYNNNSLVYITNNARLELKNGTISGNSNYVETSFNNQYSRGGGVYVASGGSFTMSGGFISGNEAYIETKTSITNGVNYAHGGGVYNAGTFTMTGGTISENRAASESDYDITKYVYGGGIYNAGTFRIAAGTVYGSDEGDLSNTVEKVWPPFSDGSIVTGAALYNAGTAERGTFNGETWVSAGTLSGSNTTINVVNGELQ